VFGAVPAFSQALGPRMAANAAVPTPLSYFSWTGCYVGGNAGWGWGSKESSDQVFSPGSFVGTHIQGGLAGGQLGCDYQFAPNWVVGIEGAGSWANVKGSSDPFFNGKAVFNAETKWIASATARIGYTWDHWLVYAKGGVAWVGDQYSISGKFFGPFNYQASESRPGWTIGGGIEWEFAQNWSAKLEYAYYDFGSNSLALFDPLTSPTSDLTRIGQRVESVTFGINYRFWSGPH
jgi:outer membrane immunogenic protein